MPTRSSSPPRARAPRACGDRLVRLDRVDDLVADGHHRVERVHRALEDHRDLAPAEALELGVGHRQHVLAAEADLAAGDDGRRLEQAQ